MTQSDAQRLTTGFIEKICESPFAIAPERAPELLGKMGGVEYTIDFTVGPRTFGLGFSPSPIACISAIGAAYGV